MDQDTVGKQFHINIMNDANSKERVEKSSNQSETYILLMNEQLNNRVKELESELNTLRQDSDSIAEDNERMEKSLTYQRGLLHNFDEINKNYKDLRGIYTDYVAKHVKDIDSIKETQKMTESFRMQYYYTMSILFTVMLATGFINFVNAVFMAMTVFGSYYLAIYVFRVDRKSISVKYLMSQHQEGYQTLDTKIKLIETKLDKLHKNNDHIGEFIDSI